MNNHLSIIKTLKYAFRTYTHHFLLLFCATFITEACFIFVIPAYTQTGMTQYGLSVAFLLGSIIALVGVFLFLGLRQIALDLYYKKKSSFGRLFSCSKHFPTFLGATFLFVVCITIAIAFLAFILIAIAHISHLATQVQAITDQSIWNALPLWYLILIIALLLPLLALISTIMFYPYFILDTQIGACESIKQSYHAARPHLFTIIALMIIFWALTYTIMNPLSLILTDKTVWNSLMQIAGSSLIKPIELLSFVYVYGHIKK